MLRIRLARVGKKGQPYYRVVVADAEAKRDGRIVENIGHYNTLTKPSTFVVKEDRVLYWLSVGAQPSDTVLNFLNKRGTMQRLRRLRAGESLEALAAEVDGPKEAPQPKPKKAAPAPAPAAEEPAAEEVMAHRRETEEVMAHGLEMEEAGAEVMAHGIDTEELGTEVMAHSFDTDETIVEEPATEVGEAYTEVATEPEAVVEMETVEDEEEGESLFERVKDAVEDAAEAVGDAAASAAGAVREAVEDIFEDEEE